MNIFVINSLFFGFSMFLLSVLVLFKRHDELGRRWFYFSIFVTLWAIPNAFLIDNNSSNDFALYCSRLSHASVAFIPATWLYFIFRFIGIERHKTFWIVWPVAWFLMAMAPSEWLVPSLSPAKDYIHMTDGGPLFHLQTVNFFGIVCYGFYLMIRAYIGQNSPESKKEILSLMSATAIGYLGGATNFALVYFRDRAIDLTLLLSVYPFLMAYAMIKHRVLDVEKIADAFQRERLAAIGLLSASINHEIKSPLFVIKGYAETLLDRIERGSFKLASGEQEESVKQILRKTIGQSERIVTIAQRLTNFSKPASGEAMPKSILLREMVDEVLSFVGHGLNVDNIQVEKTIASDITLLANRKELEQIFLNLVINASQALEKQPGKIKIEASEKQGKVEIKVSDAGPGIPPDKLSHIFEPFFTTKSSGTGLGLYITKQLVERNGGKIAVASAPGRGTTFTLEFRSNQ